MHDGGIRGVRFNFVRHLGGRPDMGFFRKTVERLQAMGWHLILHLDAADLVEFERIVSQTAGAVRHRPHGPGEGRPTACSSRRSRCCSSG